MYLWDTLIVILIKIDTCVILTKGIVNKPDSQML
jgi:hypothetical protein